MKIDIEGKKYNLLIDLGSFHPLDLRKKAIDKIKNKKSLGEIPSISLKGNVHLDQRFQIPEVLIKNIRINGLIAYEEGSEFLEAAKIGPNKGFWSHIIDWLEMTMLDGRIGWTIFKEMDCLFDFPNSQLFLAKHKSTLLNEYSLNEYVQVPFSLENFGVVLSVKTDLGIKKMLLDTGCTHSIFRASLIEKKEYQDDTSHFYTMKLVLGERDLGMWSFLLLDFANVFECDGILGLDFFKKHAICLDFHNHIAYIK